jgi:hypothetical protein
MSQEFRLSTHAIGPVRLLLGSLILLLLGAGAHWYLAGSGATHDVLVLRGGELEIEPWSDDLRADGTKLIWPHAVGRIQLLISKQENEDEDYVVQDPITVPESAKLTVDLRLADSRMVANAVVLALEPGGTTVTVNEGQFAQKGDVWAYSGFLRGSKRQQYEIARLEFKDAKDQVITRYENPNMGRRVRFRVRMNGVAPTAGR